MRQNFLAKTAVFGFGIGVRHHTRGKHRSDRLLDGEDSGSWDDDAIRKDEFASLSLSLLYFLDAPGLVFRAGIWAA